MARADQRLATASQALATLDELADQPADKIVRDATIQRFEYTFEATWKAVLAMVDHRNLTAHTYNEALADEIFAAIPGYRRLLRNWIERMR